MVNHGEAGYALAATGSSGRHFRAAQEVLRFGAFFSAWPSLVLWSTCQESRVRIKIFVPGSSGSEIADSSQEVPPKLGYAYELQKVCSCGLF